MAMKKEFSLFDEYDNFLDKERLRKSDFEKELGAVKADSQMRERMKTSAAKSDMARRQDFIRQSNERRSEISSKYAERANKSNFSSSNTRYNQRPSNKEVFNFGDCKDNDCTTEARTYSNFGNSKTRDRITRMNSTIQSENGRGSIVVGYIIFFIIAFYVPIFGPIIAIAMGAASMKKGEPTAQKLGKVLCIFSVVVLIGTVTLAILGYGSYFL